MIEVLGAWIPVKGDSRRMAQLHALADLTADEPERMRQPFEHVALLGLVFDDRRSFSTIAET